MRSPCKRETSVQLRFSPQYCAVAHVVERLPVKQEEVGSNPSRTANSRIAQLVKSACPTSRMSGVQVSLRLLRTGSSVVECRVVSSEVMSSILIQFAIYFYGSILTPH